MLLKNRFTGEIIKGKPGPLFSFKRAVRKIVNFMNIRYYKKWFCCHITLTQAEPCDHIPPRPRKRVLEFIKDYLSRAGSDFKYVLVVELQHDRYKNSGEIAAHIHMMCFYTVSRSFPSAHEVEESWGLGSCHITSPSIRRDAPKFIKYLSKYIGKDLDKDLLSVKKIYDASRVPSIYVLTEERIRELMGDYDLDFLECCDCTPNKVMHYMIVPGFGIGKTEIKTWLSDWKPWVG
jgi:hypothetical protein